MSNVLKKIGSALEYAFTWLSHGGKTIKDDTPATPVPEPDKKEESSFPVTGKVTFKDLLLDIDKEKLKAFVDGVDKEKLKDWIDKADKDALKLLIDTTDKEYVKSLIDTLDSDKKADGDEESDEKLQPGAEEGAEKLQPALNWCWGGFDGSRATETDKAQIKNLKVSDDGMSYEWAAGGCENLGASTATDADHTLACLFLDDGRGGKFDWISTSRKTRGFENIRGKYNGWDYDAFKASKKVWFCIVSRNGLVRTNLICAEK